MIKPGETKEEYSSRVKKATNDFVETMRESWWNRLSCVAREMIKMEMDAPEMIKEFVKAVEKRE